MANRRPLARYGGRTRLIASGDTIDPAYLSANLTALAGLTGAANKGAYFTGAGAMSVYDLTVFGRSLGGAADAAAGRTLLALGTAATRDANTTPTASNVPLRDASNYLTLGRLVADFIVNRLSANGGGRINLEVGTSATISATNRQLSIDVFLDQFRVYESGGTARGLSIDIAALAAGAASDYTKQTSNSDATPGRLVGVGGFGLGGDSVTVTDFDAITVGGDYQGNAATGAPVATGIVYVQHYNASSSAAFQVAYHRPTNAKYMRNKAASVWGGWTAVYEDTGWITPTLVNSFAMGTEPLRYRRLNGVLYALGQVTLGSVAAGVTITTLAAGYRPAKAATYVGAVTGSTNFQRGPYEFSLSTAGVLQAVWTAGDFTAGTTPTGTIVYDINICVPLG